MDQVAWRVWLFHCLGATIVMQLSELETHAVANWNPTAMVVLVVCYLHRIVGPLTQFLNKVMQTPHCKAF